MLPVDSEYADVTSYLKPELLYLLFIVISEDA